MVTDNTGWTPSSNDNLLGLTDNHQINLVEAAGITNAELYIFSLDEDIVLTAQLILQIHKIAFGELYDWAGSWRKVNVQVGLLTPPEPTKILNLIYQYIDNLNYKLSIATDSPEQIEALTYCHYEFVKIHPFNNGNGRTGRLLMNLVALKLGYKPLELYHREGDSRTKYIKALRKCDNGDFSQLKELIKEELIAL
ncbi:MAG: Fic family protein [Mucilaginibacter sp.]|uniref:Fic/DOC family protein n=1 Tax=Mucilaginibacter sp. TaxID=1882438 RepID=UPI0032634E47